MDIRLEPIGPDQFVDFARAGAIAFGEQVVDEEDIKDLESERELFEFDRTLAAFDGDLIVATGLIYSFQLTVPGPQTLPTAGVSWITVSPTHRRQGILTRIMRRQLNDARERGEPLAMLWASESIIYGRFGYGCASTQFDFEIDPRHAALQHAPAMDGRVQFVDRDAWHDVLPPIYDRYRLSQPGAVTRNERYWKLRLRDVPRHRHGASALFAAAYYAPDGTPEGYVLYRVKGSWEHGFAQNRVTMSDLITCTPAAHAALWKFCLNLDLVTAVTGYGTPDEPLRWMLADPRRLTARSYGDNIWVRLIDIPAALAGRRYRTADRLVLRVQDRFCPENSGTYVVESEMEGATCRSTAAAPDLELEVADLGAAYLGGVRFSTLAQAGRVQECHPGARGRADAMFAAERDPICRTDF